MLSSANQATGREHSQGLDPLPSAQLWLVDGYNALHCAPFRSSLAANKTGGDDGSHRTERGNVDDKDSKDSKDDDLAPKPFWSNTMRERLVTVARRFPDPHAEIWLVFDGSRTPESPERGDQPRVTLEFSPSADDWIVKRVREASDPGAIVVVSGDRQLTGRARHHGAAVVSPRLFLSHCGAESDADLDFR